MGVDVGVGVTVDEVEAVEWVTSTCWVEGLDAGVEEVEGSVEVEVEEKEGGGGGRLTLGRPFSSRRKAKYRE